MSEQESMLVVILKLIYPYIHIFYYEEIILYLHNFAVSDNLRLDLT
jgi:hypothetical protein